MPSSSGCRPARLPRRTDSPSPTRTTRRGRAARYRRAARRTRSDRDMRAAIWSQAVLADRQSLDVPTMWSRGYLLQVVDGRAADGRRREVRLDPAHDRAAATTAARTATGTAAGDEVAHLALCDELFELRKRRRVVTAAEAAD